MRQTVAILLSALCSAALAAGEPAADKTSLDLVFYDLARPTSPELLGEPDFHATLKISKNTKQGEDMAKAYGQRYDITFTNHNFGERFLSYFWNTVLSADYPLAGCMNGWNAEDLKGSDPDWTCNMTLCATPNKAIYQEDWKATDKKGQMVRALYPRLRGWMTCQRYADFAGLEPKRYTHDHTYTDKYGTTFEPWTLYIATPEQ